MLRIDAVGEERLTLPAQIRASAVLPSGDIVWTDGISLMRSSWRSGE